MTYDNLSRSLRNYYKTNKMRKIPGQRQVYQFIFSEKNPPQINPQAGYFIEQNNQLKKEMLFRKGLDLISQPPQSGKISQRSKKRKQEIVKLEEPPEILEPIKTEICPLEVNIEIKEEALH